MLVHPHLSRAQTEELESGARRDAHLVARGSVEALILSAPVRSLVRLPASTSTSSHSHIQSPFVQLCSSVQYEYS